MEEDVDEGDAPDEDGRGTRWTEKDTERLIELAGTLDTPDKDQIAEMMGRTPNMVYNMGASYGKLVPGCCSNSSWQCRYT